MCVKGDVLDCFFVCLFVLYRGVAPLCYRLGERHKSTIYNLENEKLAPHTYDHFEKRFKKKILKNFGPGSKYWKNLKLRSKYKKVKDWRGIVRGPWIHQNIIETVKNIKLKKKISGGVKVNESDGFCATLPYFLYGFDFKSLEKIFKIVTVSKISFKYAMAKFYLIDLALKGSEDPIKEFTKKLKKNSFLKEKVKNIKKIKKLN